MAEESAISWCDSTWNPWLGCERVSPACDGCYAAAWALRAGRGELWEGEREISQTWEQPIKWQKNFAAFQRQHGRRQRVFTASLADFFDKMAKPEWRGKAWGIIRRCFALDWFIVTKRIGNVEKMLPEDWGQENYGHVVLIITVINQQEADRDIPKLLALKMKYPWLRIGLSIEPMLGPIDLTKIRPDATMVINALTGWAEHLLGEKRQARPLDWVICGGESGGDARPLNIKWVRSLRGQCRVAGVPFHFKQWGEFAPSIFSGHYHNPLDGNPVFPPQASSRRAVELADGWGAVRIGKKRAGRMLDGVTHDGFPRQEAA